MTKYPFAIKDFISSRPNGGSMPAMLYSVKGPCQTTVYIFCQRSNTDPTLLLV